MSHNIDHTTLNWVKEEIDETLKQARHSLEEFVENQGDITQLQFTYNYIHQVHGTLQMVELYGAAMLTEEMEKLASALIEKKTEKNESIFEVLMRGIIQLPDYLEKIQSGLKDDPLILLPLLNDIRAARGEQLLSENTLFAPMVNTNVEVPVVQQDDGVDGQQLAKRLRHNFQVGLLGFYRNQDALGSLEKIAKVLTELEQGCREEKVVKTWWVASGLLEALIDDNQGPSVALNKLLGQIDREVKRLIDEGEAVLSANPADDLLAELLYYIAKSNTQGPRVTDIRNRFNLNAAISNKEEIESARQSLGGPNLELLETVSVAVREYLTQVKDALDLFLRGKRKNVSDLKAQSDILHKIADTLGMLGLGAPRKVVLEQDEIITSIINGEREASEENLMDIAHSLLEVESALERLAKQKGAEDSQDTMAASDDESGSSKVKLPAAEMKDIQTSLLEEIAVNMAKIKDNIVSYIDTPWEPELLAEVPELFNEVQGGMSIVGLQYPGQLLEAISAYISKELIQAKHKPEQEELDTLADAIASVEYYLEAIPEQKTGAESMLLVASEALEKLGYPVGSSSSKQDQSDQVAAVADSDNVETVESIDEVTFTVEDDDDAAFKIVAEDGSQSDHVINANDALDEIEISPISDLQSDPDYSAQQPVNPKSEVSAPELSSKEKEQQAKAASLQLMEDVDEDILAIFIEEAKEELDVITELLPRWKRNNEDQESLGRIRRAFHTLKGSGRLVGATEIGEFAWAFENMLNRVIDQTIKCHDDMLLLMDDAVAALPALIRTIEDNVSHNVDVELLKHRAFDLVDHEKATESREQKSKAKKSVVKSVSAPAVAELKPGIITQASEQTALESGTEAVDVMDPVLYEIFSKESAGHLADIYAFIAESRNSAEGIPVSEGLVRSLHTLHGSARMAGATDIAEIAGVLEKFAKTALGNETTLDKEQLNTLEAGVKFIEEMLAQINKPNSETKNSEALLKQLQQMHAQEIKREENRLSSDSAVPVYVEDASDENLVVAEADDTSVINEVNLGQADNNDIPILGDVAEQQVELSGADDEHEHADYDLELLEVFLEEGTEILDNSESILEKLRESPDDLATIEELQRELHTLKGGARMADLAAIGDLSHSVESLLTDLSEKKLQNSMVIVEALHRVLDRLFAMLQTAQKQEVIKPAPELVDLIENLRLGKEPEISLETVEETVDQISDEPVEVESESVAAEQDEPSTEDKSLAEDLIEFPSAPPLRKAMAEPKKQIRPEAAEDRAVAASASGDVVKVKAELLDNLVNFAGEVSIYRSRLEQQNTAFTTNLGEMGNTVSRLQDQLRKLEIETEAQILYNYEKEGGSRSDFDPLEMDRYSQVQELSRGLSESLNDISSIKNLLDNLIRESETLLLQQSRVNTDLQEGLMRTRMVPFSQIVTRLRRIVRQTCQELNKKAELEVIGEQGEIDRTVLERITAPIEHMLRNAISHGLESPKKRKMFGKPEVGKLVVEIARQGSEVMLQISDDGAGVDLNAIRSKAIERGLLDSSTEVSDHDIMQFILESGFSTAEKVTQISGRGVGMDVVNSEIKQLGGQLEIDSTANVGTRFTIHLPLTLAMNHALLLSIGEELYALPLSGIEGIVRLKREELEKYLATPKSTFEYAGSHYQIKRLGDLLGIGQPIPANVKVLPVLLVRSGDHRVALQVDGLLGSREIVVKSIGAQLSSVRGISGATILGDGHVVLILDMGGLIRLSASVKSQLERKRQQKTLQKEVVNKPTVMVVDDSITVRKVTTRLLERNDMMVITAKDGVDAVAQLEEVMPDVMLLDIEMPRMDGFELASYIRNEQSLKHIPIIMITSRTGEKHRKRAAEIGVNGYLGKPYQEVDLLNKIKKLIKEDYGDANS